MTLPLITSRELVRVGQWMPGKEITTKGRDKTRACAGRLQFRHGIHNRLQRRLEDVHPDDWSRTY